MTEKLYQLIITRLNGNAINHKHYQKKIFKLIEKGIGGFIVFGGRKNNLKKFIKRMQAISEMPLFIASDIECGVGQQIQNCTVFPCQMAVCAAIRQNSRNDIKILENLIKAIVAEAIDIGINMPLIPVIDVNKDPHNPIICTRAFSDNPNVVSWFGSKYIKIIENANLISCAKHFPGHGDTSIDSHISLPIINKSYNDLVKNDLLPFKNAIEAGVSSIMIGHLSVPVIDDKPATLSKKIITSILREKLGFDGLIITDALIMDALKKFNNIYSQCINAGADILLHPVNPDIAVRELTKAIKIGKINEERIHESLIRILEAKKRIKNPEIISSATIKHKDLSSIITAMSITILKKAKGLFPIQKKEDVIVFLAGENTHFKSSPFKKHFKNVYPISPFSKKISKKLMDEKKEFPATAIFCIFTSVKAWKGTSGIDENIRNIIKKLIRKTKKSVIISFGSPYILSYFKEADSLIAAYEPTEEAQYASIKYLKGLLTSKGRLPVTLDL